MDASTMKAIERICESLDLLSDRISKTGFKDEKVLYGRLASELITKLPDLSKEK